jgi:hypothetical protein
MHAVSGMRGAVIFALGTSACAAGAPPPSMPPPEYEEDMAPSNGPAIGLGLGADADANAAKPSLADGDLR